MLEAPPHARRTQWGFGVRWDATLLKAFQAILKGSPACISFD